jgi:hypothetical protein
MSGYLARLNLDAGTISNQIGLCVMNTKSIRSILSQNTIYLPNKIVGRFDVPQEIGFASQLPDIVSVEKANDILARQVFPVAIVLHHEY